MTKEDDTVKHWAEIRQCISDVNKATASLQLAMASSPDPNELVTVPLTIRQIAMLVVLLGRAFE
jgi:hypothetical protein